MYISSTKEIRLFIFLKGFIKIMWNEWIEWIIFYKIHKLFIYLFAPFKEILTEILKKITSNSHTKICFASPTHESTFMQNLLDCNGPWIVSYNNDKKKIISPDRQLSNREMRFPIIHEYNLTLLIILKYLFFFLFYLLRRISHNIFHFFFSFKQKKKKSYIFLF